MRLVRLVHRQHVDLLFTVHHMPEVQPRTQLQVACFEDPFEQKDGAPPTQCAYPLGLGKIQQGKPVSAAKCFENMPDPVPIGIGLDHRPDPRIRRGRARAGQVVAQGLGVDRGLDGTGHADSR